MAEEKQGAREMGVQAGTVRTASDDELVFSSAVDLGLKAFSWSKKSDALAGASDAELDMLMGETDRVVDAMLEDDRFPFGADDYIMSQRREFAYVPVKIVAEERLKTALAMHGRDADLDVLVDDKDPYVRVDVARYGRDEDLDKLVHDGDWMVRETVASRGRDKDLDILVHDKLCSVRCEVVRKGRNKDLDVLVHDENYNVRCEVAANARDEDLDVLVHDEDYEVRNTVAAYGRDKDLDILVHDSDEYIRAGVARRGRPCDIDKLSHDESELVREAAIAMKQKAIDNILAAGGDGDGGPHGQRDFGDE